MFDVQFKFNSKHKEPHRLGFYVNEESAKREAKQLLLALRNGESFGGFENAKKCSDPVVFIDGKKVTLADDKS